VREQSVKPHFPALDGPVFNRWTLSSRAVSTILGPSNGCGLVRPNRRDAAFTALLLSREACSSIMRVWRAVLCGPRSSEATGGRGAKDLRIPWRKRQSTRKHDQKRPRRVIFTESFGVSFVVRKKLRNITAGFGTRNSSGSFGT
jgi:hypothetical protein